MQRLVSWREKAPVRQLDMKFKDLEFLFPAREISQSSVKREVFLDHISRPYYNKHTHTPLGLLYFVCKRSLQISFSFRKIFIDPSCKSVLDKIIPFTYPGATVI